MLFRSEDAIEEEQVDFFDHRSRIRSEIETGTVSDAMDLLIASDLHAEFHADRGAGLVASLADADVAVLAGDLGVVGNGSLDTILDHFAEKYEHVVWCPGNHEYYYASVVEAEEEIQALSARLPNVHLLRDRPVVVRGQRFLGGTLWFPRLQAGKEHLKKLMRCWVL